MSERNLIGYADSRPEIIWPNGARVAISVVVNFEEGAELQVGDGDPAVCAHASTTTSKNASFRILL